MPKMKPGKRSSIYVSNINPSLKEDFDIAFRLTDISLKDAVEEWMRDFCERHKTVIEVFKAARMKDLKKK